MRFSLIFASALLLSSVSSLAQQSATCDFETAGITNKRAFAEFLTALKSAAASKNAIDMSTLVDYPLRVNGADQTKARKIKDSRALVRNFPAIFSDKVLAAINSATIDTLFCNSQGVMIGNGEVWISETPKNKIVVISVAP